MMKLKIKVQSVLRFAYKYDIFYISNICKYISCQDKQKFVIAMDALFG